MENKKQYLYVTSVFTGVILLQFFLLGLEWIYFIDIIGLVTVASFFAIAHFYFKDSIESFIMGFALIYILLGYIGIIGSGKSPEVLLPELAILLLVLLYSVVGYYFIYGNFQIYNKNINTEFVSSTKKLVVPITLIFFLVALLIILFGAGFGAYVDIPSFLGVAALAVVLLVGNKFKQLLLIKNYIVGYSYTIVLISSITLLLVESDSFSSYFGITFAWQLLSMIYLHLIYHIYLKKVFYENNISVVKIDIALWGVSIYTVIMSALVFLGLTS